jgi:hypothetical protein
MKSGPIKRDSPRRIQLLQEIEIEIANIAVGDEYSEWLLSH